MSTFVNVDNLWEFNSSDNSFSKITNYENNKPTPIHTLIELNDELYFTVREYQKNIEIWSYKPDSESPIKHTNFSENGENIHGLTKYRNSLYFEYFNNSPDSELWFLYSKNKNFGPVTTLQNQSFNNIDDLIVWGDKLYFTHDNDERLAYYDNYINRFSETDILMPNSFDVYGEYYSDVKIELPYKDYLFFVDKHRFNFGHEPYYLSSGSEEFKLIKDLAPGTCCSDDQSWEGFSWGSNPSSFFAYDDILYFNTSKLSSLFSNYNPSLNQSTLWHMPINEENINNPETINLSSSFDSFREVSDIIAYKGALYATADVIKDSISYGFELIKLDINVTPKVLLNVPEKIAEGKLVYLDASGSLDEDNDELSYIWQQTSGTVVDLHHSDKSIASFVAPQDSEEPLTFKIMVSDGQKQAMDSVSIAVIPNSPPTIELIDPVKTVEEDSTHQFNLSIIDVENDDVSVEWEQVSGTTISITKNDENTVFIGFPEVEGNSIVEVKITANDGNSESSLFFSVEIINHIEKVNPPTVNKSKSGGVFNFYLLILIMFTLSKIRMTNN